MAQVDRVLLPQSNSIRLVEYEAASNTLTIEFAEGSRYEYFVVPRRVFNELTSAGSPGTYFAENVRKRYQSKRVR